MGEVERRRKRGNNGDRWRKHRGEEDGRKRKGRIGREMEK